MERGEAQDSEGGEGGWIVMLVVMGGECWNVLGDGKEIEVVE